MTKRILLGLVLLAALAFAVQGGEFGTLDLFRQKSEMRRLHADIDSLQAVVDSLGRVRKALQTDPVVQERIAREEFGMVKDRELLYRLVDPADSAGQGAGRGSAPRGVSPSARDSDRDGTHRER